MLVSFHESELLASSHLQPEPTTLIDVGVGVGLTPMPGSKYKKTLRLQETNN